MEEFVLYEAEEVQDTLTAFGEISSDTYSYRLVMLIDNDNVSFEYQCGLVYGEIIEYDKCEPFDIHPKDLNPSEFDRIGTYLYDLKLNTLLK